MSATLIESEIEEPKDNISQILDSELPIFEIFAGLSDDGKPPTKHYRIFYNGRVEGFDERIGIVNWYPSVRATLSARALQKDKPCPLPDATTPMETAHDMGAHLQTAESGRRTDELPAA